MHKANVSGNSETLKERSSTIPVPVWLSCSVPLPYWFALQWFLIMVHVFTGPSTSEFADSFWSSEALPLHHQLSRPGWLPHSTPLGPRPPPTVFHPQLFGPLMVPGLCSLGWPLYLLIVPSSTRQGFFGAGADLSAFHVCLRSSVSHRLRWPWRSWSAGGGLPCCPETVAPKAPVTWSLRQWCSLLSKWDLTLPGRGTD